MNNAAIVNPFWYIQEELGVNLLKGISTTLIESNLFNLLPYYWFGVNWSAKENSSDIVQDIVNVENDTILKTSVTDVITVEEKLNDKEHLVKNYQSQNRSPVSLEEDNEEKNQSDDYPSKSSLDLNKKVSAIDRPAQIVDVDEEEKEIDLWEIENISKTSSDDLSDDEVFTINYYKNSKSKKKIGTKHRIKLAKWGKEDDKKLYKFLITMNEATPELIHTLRSADVYDIEEYRGILNSIAWKWKWRGGLEDLLRRIRRITSPSDFSIRDKKQLKRLLRRRRNDKEVDLKSILLEFPGKEVSLVMSTINEIKGFYCKFKI